MASQAREVIQQSDSVGTDKRKPVRRDPERRRQQNIQAQKKYRERLRERLDHLEKITASVAKSRAIERIPAARISPSEAVTINGSSSTPNHLIAQSLPAYDTWNVSATGLSAAISGDYQHSTPQSHKALGEYQQLTPPPDEASSALSVWDSTIHVDPSLLIRNKYNDNLGPYWITTINCGCSSPHVQIRTQGPDPFSYGEVRILSFGPSATGADLYANSLRIETVCIAAAFYALGTYVGITEEMLCSDDSISPFFRSSPNSTDDIVKANMICTVQRLFKTLKPDLRPSSEQITVKHHPYIDILPFPTLRKNLIAHLEEIDEDEFFNDMITGLVCWGGAGVGRKDREGSTGFASTGTPWDVRSWEARVWFIKKYWTLLGGEDGELVRQSEWWRSIRGDEPLDMELHS